MTTQNYTLSQFLDLVQMDDFRGIVNGGALMQTIVTYGVPRLVHDIRGAVRMSVERSENGEDFEVTQYITPLTQETLLEVY